MNKARRISMNFADVWGERWDLNPRPSVPQTDALPTELRSPLGVNHDSTRSHADKAGHPLRRIWRANRSLRKTWRFLLHFQIFLVAVRRAEGNRREWRFGRLRFFNLGARKIGPRTARLQLQIGNPVLQREFLAPALLVRGGEIEMRVSVRRIKFGGGAQMLDGLLRISHFVEHATEVEMSDDALRLDFQRGAKFEARFFQFSGFVKNAAEIDMWLAPLRLHVDNPAVKAHSLFRAVRLCFTTHRVFENLFRGAGLHLPNFFSARHSAMKWKYELSGERLDGLSGGAWGDGGDLAATGEKLQFAKRRMNFFASALERGDRTANFSRRDAAFGDALYGSQRD